MAAYVYQWAALLFLTLSTGPATPTFSKPHAHPFYISVVEVAHNKTASSLEISCRFFAEDAEAILEKDYKTVVDFSAPQQSKKIDGLLRDYIQKHLQLQADKKVQSLQYIGFEREAESLYCYFEVSHVAAVRTLDLTNSLLHDFSDKQINIMHVSVNGTRKSYKLDYPKTAASFVF